MQFKLKDSDKTYSFLEAVKELEKRYSDQLKEYNLFYSRDFPKQIEFYASIFSIPRENRLEFLRVFNENWQELDYY